MRNGAWIDANGVPAFAASPEAAPKGAVIVCFEIFGVNQHMKNLCGRLAQAGYRAVAPDFYHRNPGAHFAPYSDRDAAIALANTLTDDGVMNDIQSVVACLGQDGGPVAIVGFCLGGRIAFLSACRHPELAACVSFYGGGIAVRSKFPGLSSIPLDEADSIQSPMFLAFGGEDSSIPDNQVQAIRDKMAALGKEAVVEVYPDAGHGFMCDERESYSAAAARDGWARTLAILDRRMR